MPRALWKNRVVAKADVHHGSPCIKGTRIPVSVIVGSLADGLSIQQVIEEYPQLKATDVRAAMAYAADAIQDEHLIPLGR